MIDALRQARADAKATRAEYEVQALIWEPCLACHYGTGETAGEPLSVEFGGKGRSTGMAVVVCPGCGWQA